MTRENINNRYNRRGMAIPEWFCILGLLAIGCLALWSTFGESIHQYTDTTAGSVADPKTLLDHPAFTPSNPEQNPGNSASTGGSSPRGNNGVGNGEDPQPPGNPPVNDGEGTGPGNPGNRGGVPH